MSFEGPPPDRTEIEHLTARYAALEFMVEVMLARLLVAAPGVFPDGFLDELCSPWRPAWSEQPMQPRDAARAELLAQYLDHIADKVRRRSRSMSGG